MRPLTVLGLLCLSCATGQIGGEVGEHDHNPAVEAYGACEVTSEVGVEPTDPDLAFDLAAVIERIDGTRGSEALAWGDSLPEGATLSPAPGPSSIEIGIAYVEGSARRLEREVATEALPETGGLAGAPSDESPSQCEPLLAFAADVTITSENGAFDDTFRALFVASSPELATAAFVVVPGAISGLFDVELDGAAADADARFELAWTDGRLSGRVSSTFSDGEVASFSEFARFPIGGCLEGHDLPAESDFAQEAKQAISDLDEFSLDWPNGESTSLIMTSDVGSSCLTSSTPAAVVLPLTALAQSADGGIDSEWNLTAIVGFDESGRAAWTEVSRTELTLTPAGEFATATGITGISVDPDWPMTFSLQLSDVAGDDQPAQGTLTVLESRPGACEELPDVPSPDGGGTSPGCSGDQLIEVGTATLTSVD